MPTVAVEIVAFHVPAIPLVDVVWKASAVASLQYGPNCVNVGMVTFLISMSIVDIIAHVGAIVVVGVNVKVWIPTVAVDIIVFHVPAIPLVDVVWKASAVASLQYGPNCVNVGEVGEFTFRLNDFEDPIHEPTLGVTVIVAVPELTPMNELKSPVPDAGTPIAGLEFVH